VFYVAPDGVYAANVSLTHENLSNIFPEDGIIPVNAQYMATFSPPDFTQAEYFRLEHCNGFLYFDFLDMASLWQTFVYDISRKAWSVDQTTPKVTLHRAIGQPQTSTSGGTTPNLPVSLLLGGANGKIFEQVDRTSDAGNYIVFRVATHEDVAGDLRAMKDWGDVWISIQPSNNNPMNVIALSGGVDQLPFVALTGNSRVSAILPVGNLLLFSLGIDIRGLVNYASGELGPVLYLWQPSWIQQPVIEGGRFTDWQDAEISGNKYWQGFLMEANTNGLPNALVVRDGDTLATHDFTPSPVIFGQQSQQAFSFTTPFIAHSVRIEPQAGVDWNLWAIAWKAVPYPEACAVWQTEGSAFGLKGWAHLYLVNLSYVSATPVTLTATTDQGVYTIEFPATAGPSLLPIKVVGSFPANKWKTCSFSVTSIAPFWLWKESCEIYLMEWGSTGPFEKVNMFGGQSSVLAEV
jgi:hypothetical protein